MLFFIGAVSLIAGAAAGFLAAKRSFRRPAPLQGPSEAELQLAEANKQLDEKNQRLETEKQRIESVLYASMDPAVARLIIDRRLHNEKRPLTVLFADAMDFTSVAENMPPETVINELNRLFGTVEPVLTRFKGHIDKYLGDGVMAEFGAPYSAHHHSLLAVLAALRIQQRVTEGRFPWKLRIGIASGTTLVGLMGSENRKNYTAVGDTVNLASRLQTLCPPGSVCVDGNVYESIKRWFEFRRIRVGMSEKEAKNLEARLALIRNTLETAPTTRLVLEAANICSELGDLDQAMRFHKQALDMDPDQRQPVERAVASMLLTGEERAFVSVKGKKARIAAYEVKGLKKLLSESWRLPDKAMHVYKWIESEVSLPEEWMLSLEAIEGRIGHAQVTAALAGGLADCMGLGDEKVRNAFLAGYFNDVGKRNVSEHLLCYKGRLQDLPPSDQAMIKSHVTEAEKVLQEINAPVNPEMLQAIVQHHERHDGAGYPDGLQGDEICLLARIVRIADTYEALTSWRPYREAWTPSAALIEVCREIDGGAVDPKVGKAFLEMMEDARRKDLSKPSHLPTASQA